MKKPTAVVLFTLAAMVVFSSIAVAGVTPAQKSPAPVRVTAAAAVVPTIHLQPIGLTDEEILAAASPIAITMHGLSAHALALVSAAENESPETGGLESDGPGGPDHQFEGEETGEH